MGKKSKRSYVKKRRAKRGCLTGCLVKIMLMLGVLALLFVGACVLGFVRNDPTTGQPSLTVPENFPTDLPEISLPAVSLPDISKIQFPKWAYGVQKTGLTVKTLRAGDGEAVLVCSDGYTMLLGAGEGSGLTLLTQMLLCGVNHLDALVAMSAEEGQTGAMTAALALGKPKYLIYPDSQVKTAAYNRMIEAAQKMEGLQMLVPQQGLTFALGRAVITFVGPARTGHTDERDDGLSVRIDYGNTRVLVMGTITQVGESELPPAQLRADALICARGGSGDATGMRLLQAAAPRIALMTGKESDQDVVARLKSIGAQTYTAKEYGVMTLFSDGTTITVEP